MGTSEGALLRVQPSGVARQDESVADRVSGTGTPRVLVGPRLVLPSEDCLTVPGLMLDVVKRRGGRVALRATCGLKAATSPARARPQGPL